MLVTDLAADIRQKGLDKMIKVGIIGATGYAGGELVRLMTIWSS